LRAPSARARGVDAHRAPSRRRRAREPRVARAARRATPTRDVEGASIARAARASRRARAAAASATREIVSSLVVATMRAVLAHARDATRARRDVAAHVHVQVRPLERRARPSARSSAD